MESTFISVVCKKWQKHTKDITNKQHHRSNRDNTETGGKGINLLAHA